jgi:GNAT superfamily N-acetyltransferase
MLQLRVDDPGGGYANGVGPPRVAPWSDSQVWDAVVAHRWYPPSCQRVRAENYELAVTPGSNTFTWVYGFEASDLSEADRLLTEIRAAIESRGGTGARIQVTPESQPAGLAKLLERHGFRPLEAAEVLVWELHDASGVPTLPAFRPAPGLEIRESVSEPDYDASQDLLTAIFHTPAPPAGARAAFLADYREKIRGTGHSDRFLAFVDSRAVGCAGLELDGRVALLWGTGVLPEYRGRGIYGRLVEARSRSAVERGAEIVLVMAQTGTSGPILKRHGFRLVGPLQTLEARWSEEPGPR